MAGGYEGDDVEVRVTPIWSQLLAFRFGSIRRASESWTIPAFIDRAGAPRGA